MRVRTALLALTLLTVSSSALALSLTRGGDDQRVFPETSQRGCARVFYQGANVSAGQLKIDHGQPSWTERTREQLQASVGQRWRLGENFWTHLDTNIPVEIGGERLEVGDYYLVLQIGADERFTLVVLEASAVRAQRLDASQAHRTSGGIEIPLQVDIVDRLAKKLAILLNTDREQRDHAELVIQWGPYRLAAPVVMHPASG